MGGTTTARAAALLADLAVFSSSHVWTANLMVTHREALELHASFTGPDLHTVSLVAPRGNIIHSAGDPSSTIIALTPTMNVEIMPALTEASRASKGVRFVVAGLHRLRDWRTFLSALAVAPPLHSPNYFPIVAMAASPY